MTTATTPGKSLAMGLINIQKETVMPNHSIKTTIGVIKNNVKELLGLADTALVKKWAIEHGMGRLDMRRKYCWQMVLDAVFVWIHKGERSLCGGSMGYEQLEWAAAA